MSCYLSITSKQKREKRKVWISGSFFKIFIYVEIIGLICQTQKHRVWDWFNHCFWHAYFSFNLRPENSCHACNFAPKIASPNSYHKIYHQYYFFFSTWALFPSISCLQKMNGCYFHFPMNVLKAVSFHQILVTRKTLKSWISSFISASDGYFQLTFVN